MKTLIFLVCLVCCVAYVSPSEISNETSSSSSESSTSDINTSSNIDIEMEYVDMDESINIESTSSVEPEPEPEPDVEQEQEVDEHSKDEDLDIIVQDVFYELTLDERTLIEKVVMAESGTESYIGQCMIAQCIIDACKLENKRPGEIVIEYQYTKNRVSPSDSVKKAVAAVFDDGFRVTYEKTLYFYAPALCVSKWHESMHFVIQIENVRFFN